MRTRAWMGWSAFLSYVLCLALVAAQGCGVFDLPLPGAATAGQVDADDAADPSAQSSRVSEVPDQNDRLDRAQSIVLPEAAAMTISGLIDSSGDIDVFALGPAARGNRVIVDVRAAAGLNLVAALFDADQNLLDANDDRSYYGGQLDPYIVYTLRADTPNLFVALALSRSGRASLSGAGGAYEITLRRDPAAAVPQPRQQIVFVDFEGGQLVQIALEQPELMRPFKTEFISQRLAGQTDHVVGVMMDRLRSDFAGLDVVIFDSKQHARPAAPHSALYIGNYNPRYLGLADNVDTGNASLQQEAIIYAEDISLFEALLPTPDEVGQALANIAAHELGHLLGLEHTGTAADLMSVAASARQLLEYDATFMRAALHVEVFPIGWQDNPATLLRNVGPAAAARWIGRESQPVQVPAKSPTAAWREQFPGLDVHIPLCNCSAPSSH